MRVRVLCIAAVAVLLLAACGGSGGGRLSAGAYRTQIAKIKRQARSERAEQANVLQAKTVSELSRRIAAFSASTKHLGDEVAKLTPPENAAAANAELARAFHDISRVTHAQSAAVLKLKTPQEGIAYLERSPAASNGAHELDDAIARLKKLGYTS